MKERMEGFLADSKINHDSEQFDYISELHNYLWKFIRIYIPSASGEIKKYLDVALELAQNKNKESNARPS